MRPGARAGIGGGYPVHWRSPQVIRALSTAAHPATQVGQVPASFNVVGAE